MGINMENLCPLNLVLLQCGFTQSMCPPAICFINQQMSEEVYYLHFVLVEQINYLLRTDLVGYLPIESQCSSVADSLTLSQSECTNLHVGDQTGVTTKS